MPQKYKAKKKTPIKWILFIKKDLMMPNKRMIKKPIPTPMTP